jgi:hypothetical protein
MDKYKQSKNIPDLATALLESEQYAKRGHKLAGDAVSLLKRTVDSISRELQRNIITLEQSNINERNTIRDLSNQLALIKQNFEEIPRQLGIGLKETLKSPFSIALFGRTMSGKSTLMEILTHGDGTSIGKGAQRTTRDVRTYPYNNMIIIDVPGIAAFERSLIVFRSLMLLCSRVIIFLCNSLEIESTVRFNKETASPASLCPRLAYCSDSNNAVAKSGIFFDCLYLSIRLYSLIYIPYHS